MLKTFVSLSAMRLRENIGRTGYLLASLTVAVVTWLVLSALAAQFSDRAQANRDASVTVNGERNTQPMPLQYVERIKRLNGVADVAYMTFMALGCKAPQTIATVNAWHIPQGRWVFPDVELDPALRQAWESDETALLLGAQMARDCDWTAGLKLEPNDIFNPSQRVPVHVLDILKSDGGGTGERIALGHYDYFNRLKPQDAQNEVMMMRVYANDASKLSELANMIEAEFANDTVAVQARTSAESENTLARFGNVQALLWLVTAAMGACALLVYASTLAHMAAERRASMATLQAIGFNRQQLLGAFVLEVLAIAVAGALLGVTVAAVLIRAITPAVSQYLGQLSMPMSSYLGLMLGLAALVVVSLLAPMRTISGVHPRQRDGM